MEYMKPSFDGMSFCGIYGEDITIVDSNNVVSSYDVLSSDNDVSICGNVVKIKLCSFGESKIILRRRVDNNFLYSSFFINCYLPSSSIVINKLGDCLVDVIRNNGICFIYEKRGLSNIVFRLYAFDDIYECGNIIFHKDELIEEINIINGKGISSLLPNGHYYIKEFKTLPQFVLDERCYDIFIDNSLPDVCFYEVNLVNERKNICINLNKNCGFLEGIRYGLYNAFDIYDYNKTLLLKKNSLIDILLTDDYGSFNKKLDIPFGTYYIKELENSNIIDSNIYEFNVSFNSLFSNVTITKEPFINSFFKSDLVVKRNCISGSYFKIFDDYNNLVYEGEFNGSGFFKISNLGYGRYHFYEVLDYDNCNKIYEFFVTDNNEVIDIKIFNDTNFSSVPIMGLCFGLVTLGVLIC